eukprot:10048636-Ditylum_brightwellii.AAC.1
MKESDCPLVLWDYCFDQRAQINNLTIRGSFKFNGTTPHIALTGPVDGEGIEMAQSVLKVNNNVVPHQTLRPLDVAEL